MNGIEGIGLLVPPFARAEGDCLDPYIGHICFERPAVIVRFLLGAEDERTQLRADHSASVDDTGVILVSEQEVPDTIENGRFLCHPNLRI